MSTFEIELIKSGMTQVELAQKLGIKQPAIAGWVKRGEVPPRRVLAVEAATGIPRHVLRPDLYPDTVTYRKRKNGS